VAGATWRAAKLDFTDSATSHDETLALLDPNSSVPLVERVTKLTAAKIATPELTMDQSADGATQHVVYRDLVLETIDAGKIGRLAASGLTLALSGPQTGDASGETGAIAMERIDLAALVHIVAEGRKDAGEVPRTTVGHARIDGIDLRLANGATAHAASADLRDLGGRALAVPLSSLVDLTPKSDTPANPPAPPTPERRQAMSVLLADLLTSQSIGGFDLSDVKVRTTSATLISVQTIAIAGVAGGRIGTVALQGLNTTATDGGTLSLDRVSLAGLDLAPILTDATSPPDASASRVMPRFQALELATLKSRFVSPGAAPVALDLAHAAVTAADWRDAAPTKLTLALDHLAFDLPADDPHWRPLRDLGYSRLDLSFAADPRFDPDQGELSASNVALSAAGIADIGLSLRFSNIDTALTGRDPEKARAAMAASLFRHAVITLADTGLLTRLIETQARRSDASATEIRSRWAAGARAFVTAALADNPDRGAIADAAEKFVQRGGALTIDADAGSGLGLIDAMLAGGLQPLLGKMKLTVKK
jgi:hypothetical protein